MAIAKRLLWEVRRQTSSPLSGGGHHGSTTAHASPTCNTETGCALLFFATQSNDFTAVCIFKHQKSAGKVGLCRKEHMQRMLDRFGLEW